jgi:hypothetical protein
LRLPSNTCRDHEQSTLESGEVLRHRLDHLSEGLPILRPCRIAAQQQGGKLDRSYRTRAPTGDILAAFRQHQGAITAWFLALSISAALLAPVGLLLGRLAGGRHGRWITAAGIAAAAVQVIGLSRWFLLVPAISDDATFPAHTADAHHTFELLHTWLGEALGETRPPDPALAGTRCC